MDEGKRILIKRVPSGGTFGDLDSRLKRIDRNTVDRVIFKVDIDIKIHLDNDQSDRIQTVSRLGRNVDIFLVVQEENFIRHSIYKVDGSGCKSIDDDILAENIRTADFIDVLQQSGSSGFHFAEPGIHYVTPSGLHTRAFLRLADVIHSYGRLDRISYWLLPVFNKANAILIDNWSLSSIVLHAQMLLGRRLLFDCLHGHLDYDSEDALKVVEKLIGELNPGENVLLLVGVNASGRHITSQLDLCGEIRPDLNFSSASIYQMPCQERYVQTDTTFCHLDDSKMISYTKEDCVYCAEGEEVLYIDEKYYYPKHSIEKSVNMPAKYVKRGTIVRRSLDVLGNVSDSICVHRDDPIDEGQTRHHAFYIDVSKLLTDFTFVSMFKEQISKIEKHANNPPDLVVHPPHNAAQELIEVVRDVWSCRVIRTHDLGDLTCQQKDYIRICKHICILDDVIITGGRIDNYIRNIRENLRLCSSVLNHISVLVAVQRTENRQCIEKLHDGSLSEMNGWNSHLHSVLEVYLPNWGSNDCPWCKELDIWSRIDTPFIEPDYFKSRIGKLNSSVTSGILKGAIPTFRPDTDITLGSSSPLAEEGSSEMHILMVVAVALQMMRFESDRSKQLVRSILTNNALGVSDESSQGGYGKNVFSRYSEPLIQACLLRCAKPTEWSKEMLIDGIPFLMSKLDDERAHILLLEMLIYLKRRVRKTDMARCLEKYFMQYVEGSDDPALSILSTMCE